MDPKPLKRRGIHAMGLFCPALSYLPDNKNLNDLGLIVFYPNCSGRPLGLCGRLPELNLIPIQVIDPGKATVGFIHSFGVNLYSLLF